MASAGIFVYCLLSVFSLSGLPDVRSCGGRYGADSLLGLVGGSFLPCNYCSPEVVKQKRKNYDELSQYFEPILGDLTNQRERLFSSHLPFFSRLFWLQNEAPLVFFTLASRRSVWTGP